MARGAPPWSPRRRGPGPAGPVESAVGRSTIVGVFNWDTEKSQSTTLPLAALGLDPGAYYTVYDFWKKRYYGAVQSSLEVDTPPGSVRLLTFRPYRERPMFLSTDAHFTQGATDFTELSWDEEAGVLRGTFNAIEDTDYELRLLAPEPYALVEVSSTNGSATVTEEGRAPVFTIRSDDGGPIQWEARFDKTGAP